MWPRGGLVEAPGVIRRPRPGRPWSLRQSQGRRPYAGSCVCDVRVEKIKKTQAHVSLLVVGGDASPDLDHALEPLRLQVEHVRAAGVGAGYLTRARPSVGPAMKERVRPLSANQTFPSGRGNRGTDSGKICGPRLGRSYGRILNLSHEMVLASASRASFG